MNEMNEMEPRGEATLSMVDGLIRFTPRDRLDEDEYQLVARKFGLRWKRIDGAFVGAWSPGREDMLRDRFGVTLELAEIDLKEQAERRAERYGSWSASASRRSDTAYRSAKSIADAIPFGQPILVGHHSEKRARRDAEKIDRGMRKSVEEQERAAYWSERAAATVAAAERRERPGAIQRRIDALEADRRKYAAMAESGVSHAHDIAYWRHDGKTEEEIEAIRAANRRYAERWLAFLDMRLTYERQLLADVGGLPADRLHIERGGAIYSEPWGWEEVLSVNKKSVSVKRIEGLRGGRFWRETRSYDRIKKAMNPAEWRAWQERAAADRV